MSENRTTPIKEAEKLSMPELTFHPSHPTNSANSVSFRVTERNLWGVSCDKTETAFRLERESYRMCLHQGLLWLPCPVANILDVYSCTGTLHRSLPCTGVRAPKAIHPLTDMQLLIAAESGLYVYNTENQAVSHTLIQGDFMDVHKSETNMVAVEHSAVSHTVHVFQGDDPPTHSHSFSLNHSFAVTALTHKDHVYVSACLSSTSVCKYTLAGDLVSKWGKRSEGQAPGELAFPLVCTVDNEGSICIVDAINHSLQMISNSGEFSVLVSRDKLERPSDVVFVGEKMLLLQKDESIETFEITN